MKILFISDIHGKTDNLEVVRQRIIDEKIDKLVVLGDLYYPARNSNIYDKNAVYEFLMQYKDNIICMRGNCDSDVDIVSSDFPILSDLAMINVDGIDIYLTHGDKYNINNNRKFNRKGVLVYGHLHYPFIEEKEEMIYINVGSISYPRNDSKPSYMIYENKEFIIYSINGDIISKIKFKD